MGLKTPKLLMLGLIRFLIVVLITFFVAGLILVYHQELLRILFLSFAPVGATLYQIDQNNGSEVQGSGFRG